MFERVRHALVKSYVGAIALGFVFAQAIAHFAGIFALPLSSWLSRQGYHGVVGMSGISTAFRVEEALPELVRSAVLLIVGSLLLRWLYFRPPDEQTAEAEPELSPTNRPEG